MEIPQTEVQAEYKNNYSGLREYYDSKVTTEDFLKHLETIYGSWIKSNIQLVQNPHAYLKVLSIASLDANAQFPTFQPSSSSSEAPDEKFSASPSKVPTRAPTLAPTLAPTVAPTSLNIHSKVTADKASSKSKMNIPLMISVSSVTGVLFLFALIYMYYHHYRKSKSSDMEWPTSVSRSMSVEIKLGDYTPDE